MFAVFMVVNDFNFEWFFIGNSFTNGQNRIVISEWTL